MSTEIKQEEIRNYIINILSDKLMNKKEIMSELQNVLNIEEIDGKINCSCKLMFQFEKEFIEKQLFINKYLK